MGELSRWEDLLKTGSEDTVKPLSRVEAILRDEDITPQSRIEKLLIEGGGGGGAVLYDEYEITQNKTKIVPPVGYDGFSSVITNVPDPVLITKNVTANGEFNAEDDNADGYSSLNVNVPQLFSKVELYQVEYDALTQEEKLDPSKFYVIKPGSPRVYLYKWDFTKSLVDEVQGVEAVLTNVTRDSEGIHFNSDSSKSILLDTFSNGFTVEIDFGIVSYSGTSGLFDVITFPFDNSNDLGFVFDSASNKYLIRRFSNDYFIEAGSEIISNKTVKFTFIGRNDLKIYIDENEVYSGQSFIGNNESSKLSFGNSSHAFKNMTIKAVKIYENEEV